MFQSDKPPVRRAAVITATVAATTVASVLGFGSAALADAPVSAPSTTTSSSTSTTTGTGTSTGTGGTSGATGTTGTTGTGSSPQATGTLEFTEPSTQAAPLALTATVGTPFSHTFQTSGGTGTTAYALQGGPAGFTENLETGVLSGTPTTPGVYDFQIQAINGTESATAYVRLTVSASPLSFTPQSTKAQPLALTATAGTTFTHTFTTTGGTGSLAYAIQDSPSRDLSVNVETGVLTSTVTPAGTYDFEVVALRGTATATEYVRLTVLPAKAVGVLTIVGSAKPDNPAWSIAPGGTITAFSATGKSLGTVASIPAAQGSTLLVSGLAVDRFGNATDLAHPQASLTSSIASDRIVADAKGLASAITFPHASEHRLTVTQGGVSTSFVVAVTPTATAVVATTPTTTGKTLAYTGADETTPIAWALGLLAAGGGLLLHRLRRRRA